MKRQAIFGLLLLCAAAVQAQYMVSAKAGMINESAGDVFLAGFPVNAVDGYTLGNDGTSAHLPQMKEGQVLTTLQGRTEVLLNPSAFLRMADNSSFRLDNSQLDHPQVFIGAGSVIVEVLELQPGSIRVSAGTSAVELKLPGVYRFDANRPALMVYKGETRIPNGSKELRVTGGKSVRLAGELTVAKFDSKKRDDLLVWATDRSVKLAKLNPRRKPPPQQTLLDYDASLQDAQKKADAEAAVRYQQQRDLDYQRAQAALRQPPPGQ